MSMQFRPETERCKQCESCSRYYRLKRTTLRAVNTAANQRRAVPDDVIAVWNDCIVHPSYQCERPTE